MFEHRVLGNTPELNKDCRKQLKLAYLEQEKVNTECLPTWVVYAIVAC